MNGMSLTAAQQRQLLETLQHTHDVRQYRRSLAVLECGCGKAVNEVAQSLHVTRQSIHNWIIRFHHAGRCSALTDRTHSGRPRRAADAVDTFLCELMLVPPEQCGYHATHWTMPLLKDQLKQPLNQVFCDGTVRRIFHRMGYVWQRPRYVLATDPQREKSDTLATCLANYNGVASCW